MPLLIVLGLPLQPFQRNCHIVFRAFDADLGGPLAMPSSSLRVSYAALGTPPAASAEANSLDGALAD